MFVLKFAGILAKYIRATSVNVHNCVLGEVGTYIGRDISF